MAGHCCYIERRAAGGRGEERIQYRTKRWNQKKEDYKKEGPEKKGSAGYNLESLEAEVRASSWPQYLEAGDRRRHGAAQGVRRVPCET